MLFRSRVNFSVSWFPISENETNSSKFVGSSKNGVNSGLIRLVIVLLSNTLTMIEALYA